MCGLISWAGVGLRVSSVLEVIECRRVCLYVCVFKSDQLRVISCM